MWSKPLLYRFRQSVEIPQMQVSQGFAAFCLALSRILPRHSQTTRATNCANPGFLVIEFCSRCGQTCGQAVFLTTSTCGGSACIAGESRDCGHGFFRLEGGATRSQTRRNTNFAIPGYPRAALSRRPLIVPYFPPGRKVEAKLFSIQASHLREKPRLRPPPPPGGRP